MKTVVNLSDIPPGRPVYIYGAGDAGRRVERLLREAGMRVDGFIDSARDGTLNGSPIHRADAFFASDRSQTVILVASQSYEEILERLRAYDLDAVYNAYPLFVGARTMDELRAQSKGQQTRFLRRAAACALGCFLFYWIAVQWILGV